MDINIEVRQKQLKYLNSFISNSKKNIDSILGSLTWKADVVNQGSNLVTCPQDVNHKMPSNSMEEHIIQCKLRQEGYRTDQCFLSEPLEDPRASIYISDSKKNELLRSADRTTTNLYSNCENKDPKTADRFVTNFCSEERLILYNYAKSITTGPPCLPEFNILESLSNNNKKLSYEELLEEKRNAKRRRIKYKTVHSSHKKYTEVLRDIIEFQMEIYKEWLNKNVENVENIEN